MLRIQRFIWSLLLTLVSINLLHADDFADYKPQPLFGSSDSGVFHDLQSGELLKPITDNNRTLYLEQDGDIFEEDVATIEPLIQGLISESYSFSKSKRLLGTQIYTDYFTAFYSGCRYELKDKKFIPIHSTCGFTHRKNKNRSERIEWEHIVPAWHFGHQLQCWQNGGRLHCRNTNKLFKQMEADMHNLVPAIGEINGDRSNFKYGMIEGEDRPYGKPNVEVMFKDKTAEPPENVQGDIARTYFYMADRYKLQISDQQQKMFIAWNNTDPVDDWERTKNQRVKELQGDENLYITHYKKLQQNDVVTSDPSTDISDINSTLKDQFSFLYNYLPAWIVEILLALLAAFVWWKHKRKKAQASESDTNDEEQLTINNSRSPDTSAEAKPATSTSTTNSNTATPLSISDLDELGSGYYQLKTQLTDKVLAINNEGELVIETASSSQAQHWQLTKTNKTEGFVFIKHRVTETVLAVADGLVKDDAPIVLEEQKRRYNNHQEWKLVAAEEDAHSSYVFIENRETGYVFDVSDRKTADGSRVASFHRKSRSTENQEWQLLPI